MRRLMRSTPAIALALLVALAAGTASGSPPPDPSVAMPMVLSLSGGSLQRPIMLMDRTPGAAGAISFQTAKGSVVLAGPPARTQPVAGGFHGEWETLDKRRAAVKVTPSGEDFMLELSATPADGILGWRLALQAAPGEFFSGVFERVVDGPQQESWRPGITEALDLRGQAVDMLVKPTVALYAPFFVSSAGYGVFFDTTWPGLYDFCKTLDNQVILSHEGPALRAEIYLGDPATVVRKHALRAGPPFVPPRWTFRPWRWRDEHRHLASYYDGTKVEAPFNSEVVEDILMMEAYDIPVGAYWVDRPWGRGPMGYDDLLWDPERFPDASGMIRWLDSKGIRFLLWLGPWVTGQSADEATKQGFGTRGQRKRVQDTDPRVLIDFTNPAGVAWWQQKVRRLLEQGVAGFKLDRAEEIVPETRETTFHDGRVAREVRNQYPVLYLKAVHDVAREVRGGDFAGMPRAGFTGSSRYGVFWGGDIGSSAEGLRSAIIAAQRAALMGYPVWGSDTGGYWQAELDREVLARWLGFSAFCPIMEFGPTENRGPWDMAREPHYDAELIAIWRLYAKLHDSLADTSHRLAREAGTTGMPIIRPLFLAFPDQPDAYREWQSYLYGPDILVAPLWRKGQTEHTVWLPAGARWVDGWTGLVHEGGRRVTVPAPLYKIPIFVREGSPVHFGTNLEKLWVESLKLASKRPDLATLQREVR